jgi:hypothetical protein
MKRLSTPLRFAFTLLVIALLGACLPGGQGPSSEEIAQQIGTAVAQTIEAQGQIATSVALTVAAQQAEEEGPLPTPTLIRAEPLPTLTPILPTATPFVIAPSTSGGGGGGGGGGTNPSAEYSCDIIRQRPIDNTEFRRKHTFDVTFTILNNGTATWEAGKDLVLLGNPGPTLTTPPGIIELPEMKPGDTFKVGPFDAEAPDAYGKYVIDFKLEGGFCYPYVVFIVN